LVRSALTVSEPDVEMLPADRCRFDSEKVV
jgi:hypothetical protein